VKIKKAGGRREEEEVDQKKEPEPLIGVGSRKKATLKREEFFLVGICLPHSQGIDGTRSIWGGLICVCPGKGRGDRIAGGGRKPI